VASQPQNGILCSSDKENETRSFSLYQHGKIPQDIMVRTKGNLKNRLYNVLHLVQKNKGKSRALELTPVILVTREAEIRRITIRT
jgi:hypothetical protein